MLKKSIFKILNRLNIGKTTGSEKDFGITAVCFHRISDEIDYAYPCMPVNTFKGLIAYFSQNYSIILPEDIGTLTPKPKLIITFDDGYKDFLVNALPVLIKHKAPAIMHVVVNTVLTGEHFWTQKIAHIINQKLKLKEPLKIEIDGNSYSFVLTPQNAEKTSLELFKQLMKLNTKKRNEIIQTLFNEVDQKNLIPMMGINDLKICLKNNISIGSHSFTHENLTLQLSKDEIFHEIFESKNTLDQLLNINIENFAFPNGLKNDELIDTFIEAGYKNIFTTEDCLYTPKPQAKINIIPRIILFGDRIDENILRTNFFHARIKRMFKKQEPV